MKIRTLDRRNPDTDGTSLERLGDYDAIYRGGGALEKRLQRLLPKRPREEEETYRFRLASHHYVPYAGTLLDYLCSWLFTGRLDIRVKDRADVPEWLSLFKEDCDGIGTDLFAFVRERVKSMLVKQHSWILIDFPSPQDGEIPLTLADWQSAGLGRPTLNALDAEDVLDWEYDGNKMLLWAITKQVERKRTSPQDERNMVTERWCVWERDTWERYEITYEDGKRPDDDDDIGPVDFGESPTPGRVPLIRMCVQEGLWLMNRLYSPQLEQFRSRNALSWSLNRSCYAMRILKLEKPLDEGELPTHGPAHAVTIGTKEDILWDAPPMEAFEPIAKYCNELKDEIYRVASHMALGVDNNAAAIGRSGESKGIDAGLTEVLLRAYGMIVCASVEEMFQAISVGRREKDQWHISGLDTFQAGDLGALIDAATKMDMLAIPSRTLAVRMAQRIGRTAVPEASQDDLDAIHKEIEDGITDEWIKERATMTAASRGIPQPDPLNPLEPDGGEDPNTPIPPEPSPAKKTNGKKPKAVI